MARNVPRLWHVDRCGKIVRLVCCMSFTCATQHKTPCFSSGVRSEGCRKVKRSLPFPADTFHAHIHVHQHVLEDDRFTNKREFRSCHMVSLPGTIPGHVSTLMQIHQPHAGILMAEQLLQPSHYVVPRTKNSKCLATICYGFIKILQVRFNSAIIVGIKTHKGVQLCAKHLSCHIPKYLLNVVTGLCVVS